MASLEINKLFSEVYKDKKVLLTGHTGFKGSWLALWLVQLGANVVGLSLKPQTNPNHIELLGLKIKSIIGDIRNYSLVDKVINEEKPDIIFHLAAQAIVLDSYNNPIETYESNVMGTLNILEVSRKYKDIKAIVNVTSDKCYENKEQSIGYKETDPMGGYDPYSSSKGCAELLTNSFRNSFFNINEYGEKHNTLLASARAGNVIGGGDWANFRLIPDIIKSINNEKNVEIRSPYSTRPWQHVLEPLSGYLVLGEKLLQGKAKIADGWNFGPEDEGSITVKEVVENMKVHWDQLEYTICSSSKDQHEANLLNLDITKAKKKLNWIPIWNSEKTFKQTCLWYKSFYLNNKVSSIENLHEYINDAAIKKACWISE